jgi:hypothetical protein
VKTGEIDQQTITKYLLGDLSEEQRDKLEEQYFGDDRLYEEVRAAERDLIDNYAQGKLKGHELQRFESYFLSIPGRRQKVDLARSFNRYVSDTAPVAEKVSWWKSVAALLGLHQPMQLGNVLRFSVAMALIVVLAGSSWLLLETSRQKKELAEIRNQRATQDQELQHQRDEAQRANSELEQERNKTAQLEQQLEQTSPGKSDIASLVKPPADIVALGTGEPPTSGFGESKSFGVISPAGTAIEQDHSDFRWQSFPMAASYQVKVLSGDNVIGTSDQLADTDWNMTTALERGMVYSWQVIAFNTQNQEVAKSHTGKFKVLDASKVDFLQRARKEYKDDHLVLGMLYAQSGLLDDAERELGTASASRDTAALARQMLVRVKRIRNHNLN